MKIIYILIIGLCLTTAAYSQDSLSHYLSIAAKNNPTILQKFSEYQAALQKVPQVGSLPDPELSTGIFLEPMELVMGNQIAEIQLMQMFPWFGTLRAAKDEMSLMANAKYESFRDAKLQVLYELQQAWFELYKMKQNITIFEKNIDILRTLERLALAKYTAASPGNNSSTSSRSMSTSVAQNALNGQGMGGMSGNTGSNTGGISQSPAAGNMQENSMSSSNGGSLLADLYLIQIEISELENNTMLLKNQQDALMASFNSYLNRSAMFPVALPDTLKADTLGITLSTVSDSMLANNPMLEMLKYEQMSLTSRKKMVTGMGFPMIGLGVNYSVINKNKMITADMNGKDMIMPMVSMTLPIYRKKYKAMQTETDLLQSATAQNYAASVNDLKTEYYQAIQLYQDAQRRIVLYRNQNMLADKSFDIMMRSFAVSGSELTDILRVQQKILDYNYKQVQAVADFNIAIAWLKRLSGI